MHVPYTTEELVALHKRGLMDAAGLFLTPLDADFIRHLRIAARDISTGKRTRTMIGTLSLAAGTMLYPAPADLLQVKVSPWGVDQVSAQPWNAPRSPLPALRTTVAADGATQLVLSPPPCAAQITAFGADYPYYYLTVHLVPDAGNSTITDRELDLLMLRAKVEALRELAIRNHNKPVSLRAGQGMGDASQARNASAPALYEAFLREYRDSP